MVKGCTHCLTVSVSAAYLHGAADRTASLQAFLADVITLRCAQQLLPDVIIALTNTMFGQSE